MLAKSAAIAGTVLGWGSAGACIFIHNPSRNHILAQAFLLAIGMSCAAWLMFSRRARPLAAAFHLGYEMGRRDGIQGVCEPPKVTQLRSYVEQRERDAVGR